MAIASTYPIGTSDGAEKYLGVQASDGAVKQYGKPVAQALIETRTAAMAATIDAAVKSLRTAGYAASGDFGHGLYKRLQTAPTLLTNKGYLRSVDRFRADGTTDATHGGYWELVPEGGQVRIEQFGGKGDWISEGSPGTDNYGPMLDAMAFPTWDTGNIDIRYRNRIQLAAARYYISETIELYDIVRIHGVGDDQDTQGFGNATQLHWPADKSFFIVQNFNTGPGPTLATNTAASGVSAGSVIEGMSLWGSATWASYSTKPGILMRNAARLQNVALYNCSGKGIYIRAYTGAGGANEGAANAWKIRDVFVQGTNGDALHVEGSDANAGMAIGFSTHHGTINGCGIRDESYLGNTYIGCVIHGYGDRGVSHGGRIYQLISNAPGVGASTTPGTDNTIWYDRGAGSADVRFPAWSGSNTHVMNIPIFSSGGSNRFYNCYVEYNAIISHVPPSGHVDGGIVPVTSYTSSEYNGFSTLQIGVQRSTVPGTVENTRNGAFAYTTIGSLNNSAGAFGTLGMNILAHYRDSDSVIFEWGYKGNDIEYGRPGTLPIWEVTTPLTTQQFGRGVAQQNYIVFTDIVLKSSTDSTNARVFGLRDAMPTSGPHAKGEAYFLSDTSGYASFAWTCTASGTPGTWHTVPVFGLTSATPQYNGHLVVECTSNTSMKFKYKGSDGVVRVATLTLA